jgi:hypothetical protein
MNNMLGFASKLAFVISGLFTLIMMTSGVVGLFPIVLMGASAIILELGKCLTFYYAIEGNIGEIGITKNIRKVLFSASCILFIASIAASLSFMQNNMNKTKNTSVENVSKFEKQENNIKIQNSLIEDERKSKNKLETKLEQTPSEYITERKNITEMIQIKLNKIDELSKELQDMQNKKIIIKNETKGYISFLGSIRVILNKIIGTDLKFETIETIFFGTLCVVFEIVAILLFYLDKLKEFSESNNKTKKPTKPKIKPQPKKLVKPPIEINDKIKRIPIHVNGKNINEQKKITFDEDDINKYIQYVYDNSEDGKSPPASKINEATNLGLRKISGIRTMLMDMDILVKDAKNVTYIIKDKETALDIVSNM